MAKLITDFFTVAQSGPTVDGREIKAQWLRDAAATYDPAKYTSKIWPEHMRWRSFGEIAEVRIVESNDHTGLIFLQNRISPGDDLLFYVRRDQLTQPSIEIIEDFAGTGKAYQYGLGATDNPASLGVGKMPVLFSADNLSIWSNRAALDAQVESSKVHIFQCPTAWGDLEFKKQNTKIFDFGGLFRTKPSETQEEIDMTENDRKEIKELLQGFATEFKAEMRQEFGAKPAETPSAAPSTAEPPAAGKTDEAQTVTLEQQYSLLKQSHDELKQKFEAFMAEDVTPQRKELGSSNADDVWDWK